MEHNQSHAVQHPAVYPLDNFVLHLMMSHMSPPDEYVGTFQHLPGQAVFRLAQGGGFYRKALFFQKRLDAPVDALRIYRRDFLKLHLVEIFVPYGYANRHAVFLPAFGF